LTHVCKDSVDFGETTPYPVVLKWMSFCVCKLFYLI